MVKHTIEEMKELAKQRGGECLSTLYNGYDNPLNWKCKEGHIFDKKPRYVFRNQWCKLCSKWKRQHLCTYIFENLTGLKFPTIRLKFSHKTKLEIDGYNEDIKIGFEYQGEQHYSTTGFSDNLNLDHIKYRDNLKQTESREMGMNILIIKYSLLDTEIVSLIKDFLIENSIIIKDNNIDTHQFYLGYSYISKRIQIIKSIIENKGGELLSYCLSNCTVKCNNNHIWTTKQYIIKNGNWCRKCADMPNHGIYSTMLNKLNNSNIELLTKESDYNNSEKIQIKCINNHISNVDKKLISHKITSQRNTCKICTKLSQTNGTINKIRRMELLFDVKFDMTNYKNKYNDISFICKNCNNTTTQNFKAIDGRIKRGYVCLNCKYTGQQKTQG